MRKDPESPYFYLVKDEEDVSIRFTAQHVPQTPLANFDRVHAVEGGETLKGKELQGGAVKEYSFTVDKPKGRSHKVLFECVFFSISDPKDARYDIEVASDTGGPFKVPAANRLLPSGTIWFTVE